MHTPCTTLLTDTASTMASIQRIRSPLTNVISYRVQVRVRGHAAQSASFPNRREASHWAASIETALREGKRFAHLRGQRIAFETLVTRYQDEFLKQISPAGRSQRIQHLKWWACRFAGLPLADITPVRISEARDDLAKESYTRGRQKTVDGKITFPKEYKRSGATVNRFLATLSHMFSLALKEWHMVDRNPVRDISKKKESRGRVRFLSDAERKSLLKACESSEWPLLRTLVQLAISTGARRSELINLRWSAIDLASKSAILHETKNGDPRCLPLIGESLKGLRILQRHNGEKSEYVFAAASNFPQPYTNFDSHWHKALRKAGIDNFRFHDLRHTTASYLAAQGASLLEIADVLGHRSLQMVKRYSHLTQDHKTILLERMGKQRGL